MKFLPFLSPELVAAYGMALVDGMQQISIMWVALLFLNHVKFTNSDHHGFYVLTSALEYAVPIVANIPLSHFASKYGVRIVLTYSYLVDALGMLFFIICRASRLLYVAGVVCFAFFWSLRIIRISLVAQLVSPEYRTTAIAGHQFMVACGSCLGPVAWYLAQLWRGYYSFLGVVFDRFTVLFFVNGCAQCVMSMIAYLYLPKCRASEHHGRKVSRLVGNDCTSKAEYGTVVAPYEALPFTTEPPLLFVPKHIVFFSSISFLVRGSSGVYIVAIQPILVDIFNTTDALMAKITFIIACCTIVSPLLIGTMTRFMTDRCLVIFALSIQLFGMVMFLPIFETISRTHVVVGIVLIIQATFIFTTVSVSLFSKLLGSFYEHSYIGYLWTSAMFGVAISQAASTKWIVPFFGHWYFGLFALPTVMAILAVRIPTIWSFLQSHNSKRSESGIVSKLTS